MGVGALLLVPVLIPAVQARAKAIAVLADAVGAGLPRPFAADVSRTEVDLDGVRGVLWAPPGDQPAVILLPGAAPRGATDSRVVSIAESIARADRSVFVPELRLYQSELVTADIDAVVRSSVALAKRTDAPVVLLGFSFGGSLALLAAADNRASSAVGAVATFGSYFDLRGFLQAATTGVSIVGDHRVPWRGDPRAGTVIREVGVELVAPAERAALRAAFRGDVDPAALPAGARAAYDLITNTDPTRTNALAERLDDTGQALLRTFSPSTVADRISARVHAMHSRDDPLVPYGELLRLAEGMPKAQTTTVTSFRHVDLHSDGNRLVMVRDLLAVWSFTASVLRGQERWFD